MKELIGFGFLVGVLCIAFYLFIQAKRDSQRSKEDVDKILTRRKTQEKKEKLQPQKRR